MLGMVWSTGGVQMTRKRFVKKMMGYGFQRNAAESLAKTVSKYSGVRYKEVLNAVVVRYAVRTLYETLKEFGVSVSLT